jgi:hypothetical protein
MNKQLIEKTLTMVAVCSRVTWFTCTDVTITIGRTRAVYTHMRSTTYMYVICNVTLFI